MVASYRPFPSRERILPILRWAARRAFRMTTQSAFALIAVLAGVLALIVAATRVFQLGLWRSHARTGRTLVLRESIALDPRRRIHLVQCGQRQVVLLTGGGHDLIIGWLQEQ